LADVDGAVVGEDYFQGVDQGFVLVLVRGLQSEGGPIGKLGAVEAQVGEEILEPGSILGLNHAVNMGLEKAADGTLAPSRLDQSSLQLAVHDLGQITGFVKAGIGVALGFGWVRANLPFAQLGKSSKAGERLAEGAIEARA